MSDPFDDSLDDMAELEPGRGEVEGTWTPDWITLSGCSANALKLYNLMRLRLNRKRRDQKVWPGTATLAAMMGMKISGTVSGYLKELEELGAIDIQHKRMPRRNIYIVHTSPPAGYEGPMVLEDWDHNPANRAEVGRIRAVEKAKNDKARAKTEGRNKKPQVTADTGFSRDQASPGQMALPDTGFSRDQDTGFSRDHDTGFSRDHDTGFSRDPYREPVLKEPSPPPAGASAEPADTAQEEEEEKSIFDPEEDRSAAPSAPSGDGLTEEERDLAEECLRLRPDWQPSRLREVLMHPDVRERPDRDLVRRAFLLGARTRKTYPGRMIASGCPHWTKALEERAETSRPTVARATPAIPGSSPVADDPATLPPPSAAAIFAASGFRSAARARAS